MSISECSTTRSPTNEMNWTSTGQKYPGDSKTDFTLDDVRRVPHAAPQPRLESAFLSHLPYDCRLIIYHFVFSTPFTRIERYRHPKIQSSSSPAFSYISPTPSTSPSPSRLHTTTRPQDPSPLSLLLTCRQLSTEALPTLYSSTTFLFTHPLTLSSFLSLSPAPGLQALRSIILFYGRVDWRAGGPIYDYDVTLDPLSAWTHAFSQLARLPSLRNLEVWLSHRNNIPPQTARRPREGCVDEGAEERHGYLFEVLGSVRGVREYTVRVSWDPVDVLDMKEWPFRVELMSADEMVRRRGEEGWPGSRGVEGCD